MPFESPWAALSGRTAPPQTEDFDQLCLHGVQEP